MKSVVQKHINMPTKCSSICFLYKTHGWICYKATASLMDYYYQKADETHEIFQHLHYCSCCCWCSEVQNHNFVASLLHINMTSINQEQQIEYGTRLNATTGQVPNMKVFLLHKEIVVVIEGQHSCASIIQLNMRFIRRNKLQI